MYPSTKCNNASLRVENWILPKKRERYDLLHTNHLPLKSSRSSNNYSIIFYHQDLATYSFSNFYWCPIVSYVCISKYNYNFFLGDRRLVASRQKSISKWWHDTLSVLPERQSVMQKRSSHLAVWFFESKPWWWIIWQSERFVI